MPGSQMSRSTTSIEWLRRSSLRHSSPLSTDAVSKPSSASTPSSDSRIPVSSSTMRILCMLGRGGGECGLGDDRQFYNKARPNRLVFLHPNRSMMLFDDAANDSQAKASSALSGGEVGQKEFFFQLAGHAVSGIGDGDFDRV